MFWTVFLIGFTILLPWNILITVNGFWDYKFRNVSLDTVNDTSADTDLQKLFASYVAIASNVPNATFATFSEDLPGFVALDFFCKFW